jgi:hypothetical protein
MGRSVADLVVAAGVLFGAPDAQRDVAPLPFREVELPKKLKLGYYVDGESLHWCLVGRSADDAQTVLSRRLPRTSVRCA